jgi:anti-sigma B factor antagonist
LPLPKSRLIRSGRMRGLKIHNRQLSSEWVSIEVDGEVDLATVEDLERAIESVHNDRGEGLVVDLTGSSFMDSTGLKALVMAHRKFSAEGRPFAIAVSGGPVSRLLDLSGVNTTIRTVASVDDLTQSD